MLILIYIRNIIQTFKVKENSRFQPSKERRESRMTPRIQKASKRFSIIKVMSQRNLVSWEITVAPILIIIAINKPRSVFKLLQLKVRTSSLPTETKD
tara:strand:+ start:683 stop:973 length:291 start_codon:yes stop_codon:yes gene_type:complete